MTFSSVDTFLSPQVLHDELASMRLWVSVHVSDHSGFHYRHFLLQELSEHLSAGPAPAAIHLQANGKPEGVESAEGVEQRRFPTVQQLLHQEMELCSDLIHSFPGHEALWSHR